MDFSASINTAEVLFGIVVLLGIGWAYRRKEAISVAEKAVDAWKEIANAAEKKVEDRDETIKALTAENATLAAKTNVEQLQQDVTAMSGLTVRHGLLLDGIEDRLAQHTKRADERHDAIMGTQTQIISALDGLTSAVGSLTRVGTERTRRTDRPSS